MRSRLTVFAFVLGSCAGIMLQPALIGGGRVWAQAPSGPDTTTSTTEDSTGTVTAVSASSITLASKRGPFTYQLGPELHVINFDNRKLTIDEVHRGEIATVYYYLRDGKQTVTRIVLLQGHRATNGKER